MKRSHVIVLRVLLTERPKEADMWESNVNRHWSVESLAKYLRNKYKSEQHPDTFTKTNVEYAIRVWTKKGFIVFDSTYRMLEPRKLQLFAHEQVADMDSGEDWRLIADYLDSHLPKPNSIQELAEELGLKDLRIKVMKNV